MNTTPKDPLHGMTLEAALKIKAGGAELKMPDVIYHIKRGWIELR